jgi:hypothetical protein
MAACDDSPLLLPLQALCCMAANWRSVPSADSRTAKAPLFNDLVGAAQQRDRDGEAKLAEIAHVERCAAVWTRLALTVLH